MLSNSPDERLSQEYFLGRLFCPDLEGHVATLFLPKESRDRYSVATGSEAPGQKRGSGRMSADDAFGKNVALSRGQKRGAVQVYNKSAKLTLSFPSE